MSLLEVPSKELAPFSMMDPFNDNLVEGFLCKRTDHRYGGLIINKVNNIETGPQQIYCTPKLHYPFSVSNTIENFGRRNWTHFNSLNPYIIEKPKGYKQLANVLVYEKVDGTNICCFSYAGAKGKRYVSFKTRLVPFINTKGNTFGNFFDLWKEILDQYNISGPPGVLSGEYSISFELYGYRNPIYITYNEPLNARVLFGVRQADASIVPPEDKIFATWFYNSEVSPLEIYPNTPKFIGKYKNLNNEDFTKLYEQLEQKATEVLIKKEDGLYEGMEGFVLYTQVAGRFYQYKCKAKQMFDICTSNGGISYSAVITTMWNALENQPEDLVATTKELLAEEFSAQQIGRAEVRINKAALEIKAKLNFRTKLLKVLSENSIQPNEKTTVMRSISKFFKKEEMKKVFTTLKEIGFFK